MVVKESGDAGAYGEPQLPKKKIRPQSAVQFKELKSSHSRSNLKINRFSGASSVKKIRVPSMNHYRSEKAIETSLGRKHLKMVYSESKN